MLQDGDVDGLVQFEKHGWIELNLLVITDELKEEGFVEDGVARAGYHLGREPVLEEAHGHLELLVRPHIHEVDKGVSTQHRARHVPLVRV